MNGKYLYKVVYGIVLSLICSISVLGNEVGFPEIGKFRSCTFELECEADFNCSEAKGCEHILPHREDCKTVWRSKKVGFGVKTKVPQLRCEKVINEELKRCEAEKALSISKCRERQVVEKSVCLEKAQQQKQQCDKVKTAEIEVANELLGSLQEATSYLSELEVQQVKFKVDDETKVVISIVNSRNYSRFWSFLYNRKKYADWERIPSLGYSSLRSFTVIGNYLVLSPDGPERASDDMIAYAAQSAILTKRVGLDGMAQLYTNQPNYIEKYLVRKISEDPD